MEPYQEKTLDFIRDKASYMLSILDENKITSIVVEKSDQNKTPEQNFYLCYKTLRSAITMALNDKENNDPRDPLSMALLLGGAASVALEY